jgi:hypothetical protein
VVSYRFSLYHHLLPPPAEEGPQKAAQKDPGETRATLDIPTNRGLFHA